jgi:hypothetical protein
VVRSAVVVAISCVVVVATSTSVMLPPCNYWRPNHYYKPRC